MSVPPAGGEGTWGVETNIVEAVQQAVLREVIHWERNLDADLGNGQRSALNIDHHFQARFLRRSFQQEVGNILIDLHGNEPGFGGIVAEDITKFGRNDCLNAIVHQCPDSMLT